MEETINLGRLATEVNKLAENRGEVRTQEDECARLSRIYLAAYGLSLALQERPQGQTEQLDLWASLNLLNELAGEALSAMSLEDPA